MVLKFALVLVAIFVNTIAEPSGKCLPAQYIERLGFKCDTLVHAQSVKVALALARCRSPERWLREGECKLENLRDSLECQTVEKSLDSHDILFHLIPIHDEVLEHCNLATEKRKLQYVVELFKLLKDAVVEQLKNDLKKLLNAPRAMYKKLFAAVQADEDKPL